VARFVEGLRQSHGIIAGITRMDWLRFLAFNALGAALWVATWTAVGYLAGNHIQAIYIQANRYALYLLAAAALAIIALIIRHRLRARHDTADSDTDTDTDDTHA
jgi:membrane protein DedA with SNARE-associated domain